MKLSESLQQVADASTSQANKQWLGECAGQARQLERGIDDDVRAFHCKFGHPAPVRPRRGAWDVSFRIALIKEECAELVEALEERSLSKVAAEAVDLIYVVVGTLVSLGLPLLPFWRDVHRANMSKKRNPHGGKPLKPSGWEGPNPAKVLYELKGEGE